MKIVASIMSLCLFGYGFWWVSHKNPDLKNKVEELLDVGNFHTLEVRHSASQVMEKHRKQLLKDSRHRYLEPELHFYPYLLLEVKYTLQDDKTQENVILWDMTDGEMVINTRNWDKTHGFGDCISAETNPQEFKILSLLAKKGGAIDRDGLSKALNIEDEILGGWIESCRRKKLIVQSGNLFRLHLKHPRLRTIPETKVEDWLVTKPYKNAIRLTRRYTNSQVERIAKAAFGQNFAIRRTVDVYLPVHSIAVQNPDGTIHTTHWNALNGKQLSRTYFIE